MKANKKFIQADDHAVSAVIGVILMVAITVAIAATVYVYVTGMIQTGTSETENAGVTATQLSGNDHRLKITLAAGGQRYGDGYDEEAYSVFVDGIEVDVTGGTTWHVGEGIILGPTTNTPFWARAATRQADTGTYSITVTILDNVVFDTDVRII